MEQSFLAYDRILALVRQWQGGDISLDHLNLPVQPNTPYQLRSSCNPRRRQFDAGGKRAVAMRQISGRAAETSTQVDDLGAGADMRALGLAHHWRRCRHSDPDRAGTDRPDANHQECRVPPAW